MEHRSKSAWRIALLVGLIGSVLPQAVLAAGEVPRSSVYIPNPFNADFGDLPDSYGTTHAANGPYHNQGSLRLGAVFDWEYDGAPTDTALGDDTAGSPDDEDGVDFIPPVECAGVTLQFTVTVTGGSGTLGAWFDWNQDGDWDTGEGIRQSVVAGANVVTVVCPIAFDNDGALNARFRLYAGDLATVYPIGGVSNGEVEDYTWTFSPTAIRLAGFTGGTHSASLQVVGSFMLVASGVFGLDELRRRYLRVRAS